MIGSNMTSKIPWYANDALFKRLLEEGYLWSLYVASFFQASGFGVQVQGIDEWYDSLRDRKERFGDSIDLYVDGVPIEAKSRSITFHTPDDYPYPDVIVDRVDKFHKKATPPLAYVIVSQHTGAMWAVPTETSHAWVERSIYDRVRNIQTKVYACGKENMRPMQWLVQEIRRRRP